MTNKKWKKMITDNYERLTDEIIQAKKDMYGTDQSLHVDVEITQEGEIYTTGLLTGNTFTRASFEGESLTITSIEGWESEVNISDFMQDYHPEILKEYEKKYGEDDYSGLWEFLEENHPEIIEEAEQDYFEFFIEEYDPSYEIDRVIDSINDRLENTDNMDY